jgi:hypothetical protein
LQRHRDYQVPILYLGFHPAPHVFAGSTANDSVDGSHPYRGVSTFGLLRQGAAVNIAVAYFFGKLRPNVLLLILYEKTPAQSGTFTKKLFDFSLTLRAGRGATSSQG